MKEIVELIRIHTGVTVVGQVLTSIHMLKHQAEMKLNPSGCEILFKKDGTKHFIPFSNIIHVQFVKGKE